METPALPDLAGAVRRASRLLAASQAVSWAGVQITAALGGVVVLHLTNDFALVGVPYFIFYLGTALAAYPAGRLMDHFGRVPILAGGHAVVALGYAIGVFAIASGSFPMFLAAALIASIGAGTTYLTRLAAADLYPTHRRGRGLSLVVFSATLGAVAGVPLIALAEELAPVLAKHYLVVAWGMVPILASIAAVLVLLIRPDPRDIGHRIHAEESLASGRPSPLLAVRWSWVAAAAIALVLAQAAMAAVMSVAGATLEHTGHAPTFIGMALTGHLVGMFFFSPWIGQLGDRFGRKPLLIASSAILLGASSFVVSAPEGMLYALALFGIGLGWSFAFIGATAMVADGTPVGLRGRTTGLIDMATAVTAALSALAAGWAVGTGGTGSVGLIGLALAIGVLAAAMLAPGRNLAVAPAPEPA